MSETRTFLVAAMRRHGLGGAAVAIVRKGEPPVFECAGMADRDTNRLVDPNTVFRIASISKTMTAVGVMQLRDRGLLDLDEPVNKYLKTFTLQPPPGGEQVTCRHLLTHTAGIGELPRVADFARKEMWGMGPPRTAPANLGTLYGGTLHTETVAGAKWAYANHGFAVLGQVVEDVSGEPFATYMYDHVLHPLGMESTEYVRTGRTDARLASGYHWMFGRLRGIKDYDLSLLGPGSVLSSLTDMAIYARWLARGEEDVPDDVLRPQTLAEMMSPQYSVDPRLPGMGLAFWLDRQGTHRVAGHDGNNPGFASALLTAPDDGCAVVVLTNTATFIGAHLLAGRLLRSLLGVSDPAAELANTCVADQPHLWPELLGHYAPRPGFLTNVRSWQMTGGEVQVVVKRRGLVIRALSPLRPIRQGLRLYPTDEGDPLLFATEVEGLVVPVAFARDATGLVDRVVVGPAANTVFHRRRAARSSRLRLRVAAVAIAAATAVRLARHRRT